MKPFLPIALLALGNLALFAVEPADVVFADFEGPDYGNWQVTGDAFGAGPVHGTLPGQMTVSGYLGKGLANSFNKGDGSTGTLTSPEFKIGHKYITFLIGGGGWAGKTCLNLIVDGKAVRTSTGPNTKPGGSEALAPAFWDVTDLAGQTGHLEIVDQATGGWGHINVDQIVFSDHKPALLLSDVKRELKIEARFLQFPVKNGGPKRKVQLLVDGKAERFFDIELADGTPDWWAPLDVSAWLGKTVTLVVDKLPDNSPALAAVKQGEKLTDAATLYEEPLRQQFHFSSKRGWLNDPNGLAYYRGEYHLFYQHNPYGWGWGNMHWGHAVSRDLLHWDERGDTLFPDAFGPMFSGSAVVDWHNSSGLGQKGQPPLVLIYTSAGNLAVQCLASSTDGRNFTKYDGNPVLPQITGGNRDPKVFWHAPTKRWIMALYVGHPDPAHKTSDGKPGRRDTIQFFASENLKDWKYLSDIEGYYECPDFFELPVDDNPAQKKWVLTAANSDYQLGSFDGTTFTPDTPKLPGQRGQGFYAAQTYSDIPAADGRRIQFGWFQTATPGMAFNQGMTVPLELKLVTTPDGPRLTRQPVKEVDRLHGTALTHPAGPLNPGENPLASLHGDTLDLQVEFDPGTAAQLGFDLRGTEIVYDVKKQELTCRNHHAPLPLINGRARLRVLLDRASLEIFGNDGLVYMPVPILPKPDNTTLSLFARDGVAQLKSLTACEVRSIWPKPGAR